MSHSAACNAVLVYLSELGCLVWRNEVGLFYDRRGTPRKIGVTGQTDVSGISPDGIAIGVEVKTGAKPTRTDHQKKWAAAVIAHKGKYAVAHIRNGIDWKQQLKQDLDL